MKDYQFLVLDGYANNYKYLKEYFIRKQKEAEAEHIKKDEFYSRCQDVINSFNAILDKQLNERKKELYLILSLLKEKGKDDEIPEIRNELSEISRDNFNVHLHYYTKGKFFGHLAHVPIQHIEMTLKKAKRESTIMTPDEVYQHYIKTGRFNLQHAYTKPFDNNEYNEVRELIKSYERNYFFIYNQLDQSNLLEFKHDTLDHLQRVRRQQEQSKFTALLDPLIEKIQYEITDYENQLIKLLEPLNTIQRLEYLESIAEDIDEVKGTKYDIIPTGIYYRYFADSFTNKDFNYWRLKYEANALFEFKKIDIEKRLGSKNDEDILTGFLTPIIERDNKARELLRQRTIDYHNQQHQNGHTYTIELATLRVQDDKYLRNNLPKDILSWGGQEVSSYCDQILLKPYLENLLNETKTNNDNPTDKEQLGYNPNHFNSDGFSLFEHLISNYTKEGKVKYINIFYFIKEHSFVTENYRFSFTIKDYKNFILNNYDVELKTFKKAKIKFEDDEIPALLEIAKTHQLTT